MIAIKGGTQTFSKAEQTSSLKGDGRNGISASDQAKHFGEQNLGDVLNKVADPNYIDPSKKVRQVGNNQLGKDAFMKLLLTQLKNQDPTNPLESHEMAAHLAQFTSLEKLEGIDSGIKNLGAAQKPQQKFQTLNLIGKAVSGDSSKIFREDVNSQHTVSFNLLADAKEASVKVRDAIGNTVTEVTLKDLKAGKNQYTWNGLTETGRTSPQGEYSVVIEARNDGKKIGTETKFEGKITGVNFTAQGPVLLIGDQSVRMTDVKKIIDPSLINGNVQQHSAPAGKVKGKGAAATGTEQSIINGGLSQVGMSRDMINKINKEAGSQE